MEFKNEIKERLEILKMNFLYSNLEALMRVTKSLGGLMSVLFYNFTFILFINVVYSKVKTVGGYNFDDMMVLTLVGECCFILLNFWINENMTYLVESIWSGSFDLILNKPLPTVWYMTFRSFNTFDLVRNGIPPIVMISLFIHWENLHIEFINVICGVIIFFCGQIILSSILFMLSCIEGFWDKKGLRLLADQTIDDLGRRVPNDGYNPFIKNILLSILPIGIVIGLSTSVILGKTQPLTALVFSILVTIMFLFLKMVLWKKALIEYSSASS